MRASEWLEAYRLAWWWVVEACKLAWWAAVACKLAWLEEVAYKLASEAWEELACCKLASPGSSA